MNVMTPPTIDREAEVLVNKMISRIAFDEPFFSVILSKQIRVQDPTCKTMWVDGMRLGYNPDFVKELDRDELKGVLIHEVMHLVHLHHLRRGNRHPFKWNVAGDFVINWSLVKPSDPRNSYKLPEGCLLDAQYEGMSTDQVYSTLPEFPPGGNGNGDGDGDGDGRPNPLGEVRDQKNGDGTAMSEHEKKVAGHEMKVTVNQAYDAAKRQGNCPAGIERLVEDMNDPKLPWKEILSRFTGEKAKTDLSWSVPNRRWLQQNIILPGPDGETFGKPVMVCDTSCSIDSKMLQEVVSEMMGCLSMFDEEGMDVTLTCMSCDTKVDRKSVV